MNERILELSDIHTSYGQTQVLRGVHMGVDSQKVVSLLGRNGMGKTTIIRTIIGFNTPYRGVVRFKAREISGLPAYEIAKLGSVVSEDDEVVFYFSGHCFPWVPPEGMPVDDPVGIVTWRVEGDDAAGVEMILDLEMAGAFAGFTNRIVFIFDCCYAGGMMELAGDDRIVCMAAGVLQQAAEVGPAYAALFPPGVPPEILHAKNGLFTYFFAELGLLQYGLAVEEAFSVASDALGWMTEMGWLDQTPVIYDGIEGDLYL